uniref:Putative secreted protein n=1 Tax=Lutzomyia longipalpis TaxID=7200 RepID=A0A1B0GIZ5_LUTLO
MIRVKRCRFSAIFALIISLLIMAANFNSVVAPPGANPGKKWDKGWDNDWNEYNGESGDSTLSPGSSETLINQSNKGVAILSPNINGVELGK